MRAVYITLLLWKWLRKYFVAVFLVAALLGSLAGNKIYGTGPTPQQPPEGYELHRGMVTLHWDKGTQKGDIVLQVSVDNSDFSEPLFEKKLAASFYTLRELERGKQYYWRLLQNNKPSPTASFKVYKYNVNL